MHSYPRPTDTLRILCRFENKGSMMGCSNPHPHGQAWSLSYVPSIPERMIQSQRQFAKEHEPVKGVPTLYVLFLYPIRETTAILTMMIQNERFS